MSAKDKDTDDMWEVTGGVPTTASTIAFAAVGPLAGEPTKRYHAENRETGEKREVLAETKNQAERKAREGKFEKR